MLRVRPIHFTSRLEDYATLLTALGLRAVEDSPDWRVFDSGDGRIALHRAEPGGPQDGLTVLGFEIRDRDEFSRRTVAAGTRAEFADADRGPSVRVTAPDGFAFLADPVQEGPVQEATEDAAARPALAVLQLWKTPNPAAAQEVLTAIGARPAISSDTGGWATFRAKNGGLAATHHGEHNAVEPSFEYAGDLEELLPALAAAGLTGHIVDEAYGRTLHAPCPDRPGATLWINEAQRDLYGYTRH
ncbi:VOC family protein [Specibacter cremeus]|uniref:VOC family protein n=1 Tax=Specibacter cremeus TaxID=1629051 RepID=UPI000F798646|nr:VOC family protein [Specibacter cremeus]